MTLVLAVVGLAQPAVLSSVKSKAVMMRSAVFYLSCLVLGLALTAQAEDTSVQVCCNRPAVSGCWSGERSCR